MNQNAKFTGKGKTNGDIRHSIIIQLLRWWIKSTYVILKVGSSDRLRNPFSMCLVKLDKRYWLFIYSYIWMYVRE